MDNRKPWFELWFDSPYYPILYKHRNEEEAQTFIDMLIERLKPRLGAAMLDLACGRGRHAAYLASKGFEVIGLDISPNSIEDAMHKYGIKNPEFYVHDMRNYFRINYFDYIFNFFTSIGYFDNLHDNEKVVKSISLGLKKGGRVLIDFMNTEKVSADLVEREQKEEEGILFDIRRSIEEGCFRKHIYFTAEGKKFSFTESVQALLPHHFHTWLNSNGLHIVDEFGDYQLNSFDPKRSPRYIVLAEKH